MKYIYSVLLIFTAFSSTVYADANSIKKLDLACVYETDLSPTGMKILKVMVIKSKRPLLIKVSSESNRKAKLNNFAIVIERHWKTQKLVSFYTLPSKMFKLTPYSLEDNGNYIFSDRYKKAKYTCSVNKKLYPSS